MYKPLIAPPILDGTAALRHDGFDVTAWETATTLVPEAMELTGETSPRTAPGLARDVFWSLHQAVPAVAPNAPLAPGYEFNAALMGELMATAEWTALRNVGTIGDELTAGLATVRAARDMIAALPPETQQAINDAERAGREATALEQELERYQDLKDWFDEEDPEHENPEWEPDRQKVTDHIGDLRGPAGGARAKADGAVQVLQGLTPAALDPARAAGRESARQAKQEIEDMQKLARTFGGWDDSPAERKRLPAERVQRLAQHAAQNPVLKDIAAILGRMQNIALRVTQTKTDRPPTEVVGIELGQEIPQLLPAAWSLLELPETTPLFYKGFVSRELPQYELIGQEAQGLGTMEIAVDQSSSMLGDTPGSPVQKRAWAAAVEIALVQIAGREKRDVVSLHFSTDLEERIFPEGKTQRNDVLDMAEAFLGGGTDYHQWMRQALTRLRESRFAKADVIILSDGQVRIGDTMVAKWNEARAELGFKCIAVLIGTEDGHAELSKICDAVIPIGSLRDDGPVLERIFAV